MSKRGVRKIATWRFEKDAIVVEVPVHLVDEIERSHRANEAAYFKVDLDEHNIHVKSQNLTTLRKKVFAALDARVGLTWEPWLHVAVSGNAETFPHSKKSQNYNEAVSVNVSIDVSPVLLATTPDGQKLRKDHKQGVRGYGYKHERRDHVLDGWPTTTRKEAQRFGAIKGNDEEVFALVRDAPENRIALNLLSNNFGRLVLRLFELLNHEQAQHTLTNANLQKLLSD